MNANDISSKIDHTLLRANATAADMAALCDEAVSHGFAAVCVNPVHVAAAAARLRGTGVKVATVIGFPLGASSTLVKALEARDAIAAGADELDMVINVGALVAGDTGTVRRELEALRAATAGKILKVIIETAYLTREQKVAVCLLAKEAGADFVKTSTGFGPSGATAEDVQLMRETVGPSMGVKASGGIRTRADAETMIAAGASRLGTSASVAIVQRT